MIWAALTLAASPAQLQVEGWRLEVSPALFRSMPDKVEEARAILAAQLREVTERLPVEAAAKLKGVKLWMSLPPEGEGPGAAYHPSEQWLRENGRDPRMAKGIEFTNVAIFEEESRRMPNFALHELAHAWHDQHLPDGFQNGPLRRAYEAARVSGRYDRALHRDAEGRESRRQAYAMQNPMEFFAELTEALFSRNDIEPFDRIELGLFDPDSVPVVRAAWGIGEIERPPAAMKLDRFYEKYFDAEGFPVVSSGRVNDFALKEAGWLIGRMLAERPDLKRAMVEGGSRMVVIAWNEFTTDIPEYRWLEPAEFWDRRARGLGGSETDPVCSCAEENVLGCPGDPYAAESIVIHEFAHSIHLRGLNRIDSGFQTRLQAAYDSAMEGGLWKGKYAATNPAEYFAEGVQSWFDNNRENDDQHNHVNTRAELTAYDLGLAALLQEVFRSTELAYTKPASRLTGHLAGYDPSGAPTFRWRGEK